MSKLVKWLKDFFNLFKVALIEALPTLLALGRDLIRILRLWCREMQKPERERRRARSRCVPFNHPSYKRPDPTIYSQTYLIKLGLAVTWDNPDIQLYKGGVSVSSSSLDPDTDYEIVARIWNNSTEAPVVDLPVRFSYLSFGVGTQSHPIDETKVLLGVKGGANHPAFAKVKWHTPSTAGHYCIQAFLDWLDDANPNNNLGQENTDVGQTHSPANFVFALHNSALETLQYHFEVDSYQIPHPRPCDDVENVEPREAAKEVAKQRYPEHDRANYPLPSGWIVDINPREPELSPDAEQIVNVAVTAPIGFTGRQPININVFNRYGLAGGITLYVEGT
jgi:hypothetical protein